MAVEIWKSVVGYERYYEVSSKGRVRRIIDGPNTYIGKILGDYGIPYRIVILCVNGVKHSVSVHKLVAAAFIGPCPEGKEVNHKDLNKANNRYKNLEYKTGQQNMDHAVANGVKFGKGLKGKANPNYIHVPRRVINYIKRSKYKITQKNLGLKFGISAHLVWRIMNRPR